MTAATYPGYGSDSSVTKAAIAARRRAQACVVKSGRMPADVAADLATAEALRAEWRAQGGITESDVVRAFDAVGRG